MDKNNIISFIQAYHNGEDTVCIHLFPLTFIIIPTNNNTASTKSEEAVNKVSTDIEERVIRIQEKVIKHNFNNF